MCAACHPAIISSAPIFAMSSNDCTSSGISTSSDWPVFIDSISPRCQEQRPNASPPQPTSPKRYNKTKKRVRFDLKSTTIIPIILYNDIANSNIDVTPLKLRDEDNHRDKKRASSGRRQRSCDRKVTPRRNRLAPCSVEVDESLRWGESRFLAPRLSHQETKVFIDSPIRTLKPTTSVNKSPRVPVRQCSIDDYDKAPEEY